MSTASKASRAADWMESLGDWSWPGTSRPVEILPPSWVPALPPRLEPVAVAAGGAVTPPRPIAGRRVGVGALLSALAAASATAALGGPEAIERLIGYGNVGSRPVPQAIARPAPAPATQIASVRSLTSDPAGSSVAGVDYHSAALSGTGTFYVYLPPGYGAQRARYPVIYLLHGNSQPATAFLQVGLQGTLDRLISERAVPPMIAIMIQGGPGANNWRNEGHLHYADYVIEVQQLADRLLPTIRSRGARALAGDSMGGYGALHITLNHLDRFSVAESWLGFFDGLQGRLHADRADLHSLGLDAFLYGAQSDKIANPAENEPFAAEMRAAGADAHAVVYPGEHSLQTVESHLESMLVFAGRALARRDGVEPAPSPPTAAETAVAAVPHHRF